MAKKKYLDFTGLEEYDDKIKALIDEKDATTLASSKSYSDSLSDNYDAAGSAATALAEAKAHADSKDPLIAAAKKAGTDAQATANTALENANSATASINSLTAKVGTVPDGKNVMGIIKEIQDNAYDDSELRGLVTSNTSKITTLVGSDANKSVRSIANEELAAQLIPDSAKESLDTLAEIAIWIQSHPDDAAAMNEAIDRLTALVGTIPEGVTATTIVDYIAQINTELTSNLTAVDAKATTNKNKIADIDTKLGSVQTDVTGIKTSLAPGGSVTNAIAAAKKAGTDAQTDVDVLEPIVAGHTTSIDVNTSEITALKNKVGDGFEEISSEEISGLFIVG